MTGGRDSGRRHSVAAGFGIAGILIVALLVAMFVNSGSTGHEDGVATTPPPSSRTSAVTSAAGTTVAHSGTSTSAPPVTLAGLIAQALPGGASISAVNTVTGRTVTMGAGHGMLTTNAGRLALLEVLLLERQRANQLLTNTEDNDLTTMIEHGNTDAADAVFDLAGGHQGVVNELQPLGLDTTLTVYGSGNQWGLATSSAGQQVILLRNLVDGASPLNGPSREYAMSLLTHVEADQRWGVPVAADTGTTFAVTNGWVSAASDHGRWAVNSDGVITVHGQQVLVSVMTQHDSTFDAGVAYCQALAQAAVAAVT